MNNAEKLKIYKSLMMMSARTGEATINKKVPSVWSSFEAASSMWKSSNQHQHHQLIQNHHTHRSYYSTANESMLLMGGSGGLAAAGAAAAATNVSPRRPYLSNEDLNLMCPVSLHEKLANNRYDIPECRCRKLHPPQLRDLEFDYFIRLLPTEQLAIVLVIDSQYNLNKKIKKFQ